MVKIGFNGIGIFVEYSGFGGVDIEKVIVVIEIVKKCVVFVVILLIYIIYV